MKTKFIYIFKILLKITKKAFTYYLISMFLLSLGFHFNILDFKVNNDFEIKKEETVETSSKFETINELKPFYKNEMFWIITCSLFLTVAYFYFVNITTESIQHNCLLNDHLTYEDYFKMCDEVVELRKQLWFETMHKERLLLNIHKKEKLLKLYDQLFDL